MKRKHWPLFLLILGLLSVSFSAKSVSEEDTISILFVGNSHFNTNNLPERFRLLAESSNREVYIGASLYSGLRLIDQAYDLNLELLINSRKWDYIVLQGVGPSLAYPKVFTYTPVLPALTLLKEKILANSDSTKIVFCMPWAYEDGMTWYEDWTDTYEDMQLKNYHNTLDYCYGLNLIIAPVGWAWYKVLKEKGFPLHYLHDDDWSHPTPEGSYLMACVFYSTIYQESTHGIEYHADLETSEAEYFQIVASIMVLDNYKLWNIPRLSTSIDNEMSVTDGFLLLRNYPNPFRSITHIEYETKEGGNVEISLYNQYGQKLQTLVNNLRPPGRHYLTLDRKSLPSGIYYLSMNINNNTSSRKLIIID